MATAWIYEICGRANQGDLCPGCATPRPFNVRFWRIGHLEGWKGVYDGVSPSRFTPLILVPLVGFVLYFFHFLPMPWLIGILAVAGLMAAWKWLVAGWWLLWQRVSRL